MNYVVGFAYGGWVLDTRRRTMYLPVLLQRQADHKPFKGLLNGPGGKPKLGESARGTMAREFLEETGINTDPSEWQTFHVERWKSGNQVTFLHLLSTLDDRDIAEAVDRTRGTAEPLVVCEVSEKNGDWDPYQPITENALVYNLPYLLRMSRTFLAYPEHQPL